MLDTVVSFIKASRPLQFALVFVAGGTVAALFYPTKIIQDKLQKTFDQQTSVLKQQHAQELSSIQESFSKQTQELKTTNEQLSVKVTSLITENTSLKVLQKKTFFKIVHPDGTVEERASSTTDSDQEQQISQQVQQEYQKKLEENVAKLESIQADKISTMQKTFDSKEQDYQHTIATLTQTHSETINPKNFTLDGGLLTNGDYYGHVSYDIWGPFVLGVQGQFGPSPAAGAGLGIRF
ncbi:unnamed protein product [Sphagnum balticum]